MRRSNWKMAETPEDWAKMMEGIWHPMRRAVYPALIAKDLICLCPEGCLDVMDEVEL